MAASEVPEFIGNLVASYSPVATEANVVYFGTNADSLDKARAGKSLGIINAGDDLLDRYISQENYTYTSLAFSRTTGKVGAFLQTQYDSTELGVVPVGPGLFVGKDRHIAADRSFGEILTPALQGQFEKTMRLAIEEATDKQLVEFILQSDPLKMFVPTGDASTQEEIVYLPKSMNPCVFGTEYSFHPTRSFVEPIYRLNQFQSGRFIGDAHVHFELTEKIASRNPGFYQRIIREFGGSVEASNMLSLPDINRFRTIRTTAQALGLPTLNYAFREIYVVDAKARVVAHSVFNFSEFAADSIGFKNFMALSKATADSSDPELRMEFQRVVKNHTKSLPVDQPISVDDYYPSDPVAE
jgi:hypothetical protein